MAYGDDGVTGRKNRTKPTEQADDQKIPSRGAPSSEQVGEDEDEKENEDGDAGVDADRLMTNHGWCCLFRSCR